MSNTIDMIVDEIFIPKIQKLFKFKKENDIWGPNISQIFTK